MISKQIHKTYIDNSRFMEFIDEIATQTTKINFGADTWGGCGLHFTDEAQNYYNEMYNEYEMMANNIMGVYNKTNKNY